MREGRLKAMCLWSPAEPACWTSPLAVTEWQAVKWRGWYVQRRVCVCACMRAGACVRAFSLGENKRCEIETKRQIGQLMQTHTKKSSSEQWATWRNTRGESDEGRYCSRARGEWEGGWGEPSFLWLSQAGVVGLGWLRTLGFTIKARERERVKKNHSQKMKRARSYAKNAQARSNTLGSFLLPVSLFPQAGLNNRWDRAWEVSAALAQHCWVSEARSGSVTQSISLNW